MIKQIILFILPLLLSGLIHHFFIIKYNLFSFLAKPIDFDKKLFGKNKTFRGFLSMVFLTSFFFALINYFLKIQISLPNFAAGAVLGLFYSLAELPNSFIKRKVGVKEGLKSSGLKGFLFSLLDQIDSPFGVVIAIYFIFSKNIELLFLIFAYGSIIHFLIDQLLYKYGYKNSLIANKIK
jgi:hypothetical protein